MSLSISHRITGVFLTLGLCFLSYWLLALASGPETYARVAGVYGSVWFRLLLAVWVFCFFYHLANGIRHLVWDSGRGFEPGQIKAGGIAVVAVAVIATAAYVSVGLL